MASNRYYLLFKDSPELRLLRKSKGAFLCSFLFEAFKKRNRVEVSEEVLETQLEECIEALREVDAQGEGEDASSKSAREYLGQWCGDEFRLLRKNYLEETREYAYKLTRYAEKALDHLEDLRKGEQRGYTTAQSRFVNLLEGLKTLSRETDSDPVRRIDDLLDRRRKLDEEIRMIRVAGVAPSMNEGDVKDKLHDLSREAEGFLSDFRAIEDHFKEQAKEVGRKFSEGDLVKGDVVEQTMDAEDDLRDCDQGRSFFGFSELMERKKEREALRDCSEKAAQLAMEHGVEPEVFEDLASRLIAEEGVVRQAHAGISKQLKRVVEDFRAGEARRVKELLSAIRKLALGAKDEPPEDASWPVRVNWPPTVGNFMEVRFYEYRENVPFGKVEPMAEADEASVREVLRGIGKPLNLVEYRNRVKKALENKPQVSLRELLATYPPADGVVELIGYHAVAGENGRHVVDESDHERHDLGPKARPRFAEAPRILFQRS